jgi:AcrR family transcriptional regulator
MTGLRERKKREIRHRMIETAARLFAEKGIDATTMEEIAAAADVSVGTVYNYFGTKNRLLLAGIEEDTDAMIASGSAVIDAPGPDPIAATQLLLGAYLDHFTGWDRRLLREIFGAAFQRTSDEELATELFAMDERLIEQMVLLLSRFQRERMLRPDVDISEATLLVFSGFVTQLFMYMGVESFTPSDLRAGVNRQTELAFSGLSTNEKAKGT